MLFALCIPAQAQQAKKVPRIGILFGGSSSRYSVRVEAFRQRLKELGYIEGKNIAIEYRYADGKADRLLSLATELVLLKVDVIVAYLDTQRFGYPKSDEHDSHCVHRGW